jgi:hypothetical protein
MVMIYLEDTRPKLVLCWIGMQWSERSRLMKKKQKNQIGFCVLRGGARSKRVIKAHGRRQEVISLASRDSFCDLLVELAIIQTTTSNINII